MAAALLLCLFLIPCESVYSQGLPAQPKVSVKQAGLENSLAILFTGDLHSCVDKYPKLATFIKQEKLFFEKKGFTVIVVDAGDIAMGSVFSAVTNTEASEYRALGLMGYDAYVFGNHDFDIGLKSLGFTFYNANIHGRNINPVTKEPINFPVNVTANLGKTNDNTFENARSYIGEKSYIIMNRNGVKIGIFGLLGKGAFNVCNERENMTLLDPIKTAKTIVQTLKTLGVDYIICLSHSGTLLKDKSEDGILAKECPDIDVIISGHDHEAIFRPWQVGNVVIGAAGSNGAFLGEVGISNGDNSLKERENHLVFYGLRSIPSDTKPDPALKMLLDSVELKVIGKFNNQFGISPSGVVTRQKMPLDGKPDKFGDFPLGEAIARSYFYAAAHDAPSDIDTLKMFSVVPAGVIRKGLSVGNIKYSDAFDILPLGLDPEGKLGYPIVECWITGKELKDLCEVNASIAGKMPDAYMTFYGLTYTYNPAALPFFRVKKVYLHGKAVQPNELYHVVTGYYTAMCLDVINKNSHGLLKIIPKDQNGTSIRQINDMLLKRSINEREKVGCVNEWYAFAEYMRKTGSQPKIASQAGIVEYNAAVRLAYAGYIILFIIAIFFIIRGIIWLAKGARRNKNADE